MKITVEIPDDVAVQLKPKWSDLERGILEAVAAEGYRQGVLGRSDVEMLLDLYYDEANRFLRKRGCDPFMTAAEIEEATRVVRETTKKPK